MVPGFFSVCCAPCSIGPMGDDEVFTERFCGFGCLKVVNDISLWCCLMFPRCR